MDPNKSPGTRIFPEDLEAWENKAVKVTPGDALILRWGKWARRVKMGPEAGDEASPHPGTISGRAHLYRQRSGIGRRQALFIKYEKTALNVPFDDPVPHYQGPAFTEGVPEANPLSCRQRRLRMGRAEAAPAVVYQAAPKLP